MRDLPIPASPVIRTTAPRPDRRARFSVRRTRPISAHPTHERVLRRRPAGAEPGQPGLPGQREEPDDRRLPAQHDRTAVVDGQAVAAAAHGRLVEQDLARPGEGLDPGRGRDRLAGHREVAGPVAAGGGHDLAGREADPDLERLPAVVRLEQHRPDLECREGRPDGVVVVGVGPAEDREDGVADELLARPLEPLDGLAHPTAARCRPGRGPPRGRARRASGRSRRDRRRGPSRRAGRRPRSARLVRERCGAGPGRSELGAALIAEAGAPAQTGSAGRALHDGRPPLQGRPV